MDKVLFSSPSLTFQEVIKRNKRDIAIEFESILLKEILKEAFRPMLQGKSFDTRLYYDSFLEGISKKVAEVGGIGIAKFILENLKEWEGLKR